MKKTIYAIIAGLTVTLSIVACAPDSGPAVAASTAAEIDEVSGDYIEGLVQNETGNPEAGVWVIAETDELATPYRKIVVTDDEGRFVLPQLPEASFEVWVRGYGLSDSIKKSARPGERLELSVTNAASEIEAASIYPASYWLSLLEVPNQDPNWISNFKLSCQLCHQVGSLVTRIQDRDLFDIGMRKSTNMNAVANDFGREQLLDTLADWTARIRKCRHGRKQLKETE